MNHNAMIRGYRPGRSERRQLLLPLALLLLGLLMLLCLPGAARTVPEAISTAVEEPVYVLPQSMKIGLPEGITARVTVTQQRLLQGKMLLVDQAHPIPEGVEPPSTHSVLGWGMGRIACRDLQAQLGMEAMQALYELCIDARNSGIMRLTVFAATRSQEQQRELLNEKAADLTRDMPIEEAVAAAKQLVDPPGCSEHQLPCTVDIRITRTWRDLPDASHLRESEEGAWLLNHGWEYGFIQRYPDADPARDDHRPYCFRFVDTAHARLMHETGLCLEDYLALLREVGSITLYEENAPLMSAVCVRAGERHTVFELPQGAQIQDASIDNLGWAVVSVTYPEGHEPG